MNDRTLYAGEFNECDSCASKPGSPTLCPSCLTNRDAINYWQKEAEKANHVVFTMRQVLRMEDVYK